MAIKVAMRKTLDIAGLSKELEQPAIKVVIYFFSIDLVPQEPHKAIKKAFPQATCIGSSMIGGWCTDGVLAKGIVAMSLSSDEVAQAFVSFKEGVKKDPSRTAQAVLDELKRALNSQNINPNDYMGIILFDGLCHAEDIINTFTLAKGFNLPIVGGAAADEGQFVKTFVSADTNLSDDGLVVMIMKMKIPFICNHYVHYTPTSTSFVVSKVDTAKRIVWEIDNKPAAEVYAKHIGVSNPAVLTPTHFAKNPVGIVMADTVYVRSIDKVTGGTGLQFHCCLQEATRVYLLKQGDIIANAQSSLDNAATYLPNVQGALLFNCMLRYMELQDLHKVEAFNSTFKHLNFIGFNTFGEELYTHHNQTLTAVFFGSYT
ncbi:hypothetical protein FACS1894200_04340 [Spirochaetia bacterium]|nr:hypothetical protein FACS1894200_04340 [Spirochaetia bacterium]